MNAAAPVTPEVETMPTISLRPARAADAPAIWRLVRDSGVLDVNSPYAYVLLCSDFAAHAHVAVRDGEVVGFVCGYAPPARPDVAFVWQIGVAADARGHGLGGRLLEHFVDTPGARWLEATVTPSNTASRRLFEGFARRRGVECAVIRGHIDGAWLGEGHEREDLFRIGPFGDKD